MLGFQHRFAIAGKSRLLAGAAAGDGAGTPPRFSPAERVILCVDMDAFFASVEQRCAPRELEGKPVIVCGNTERRSAVAAANYIAREYGIKAGTPITTARRLCPHAVFIEGDPEKYVYTNIRINETCREFTPVVEAFSIDESFLDVTGSAHLFGGPVGAGRRLKERIRQELGLPCTVGIGPARRPLHPLLRRHPDEVPPTAHRETLRHRRQDGRETRPPRGEYHRPPRAPLSENPRAHLRRHRTNAPRRR